MNKKRIGWLVGLLAAILLVVAVSGCEIVVNGPPYRGTVILRSDSSAVWGRVFIREPGDRYRQVGRLYPYEDLRVHNVRLNVFHDIRIERNGWPSLYFTMRPSYSHQVIYLY